MKVYSVLRVLLVTAAFLSSIQLVYAQGSTGNAQLNGTVTDPSGSVVAGASMLLRNTATDTSFNAVSNDRGLYAIANVPPGAYELKVSSKGFANYTQTGIVLTVAETRTVDVALKVASAGVTEGVAAYPPYRLDNAVELAPYNVGQPASRQRTVGGPLGD